MRALRTVVTIIVAFLVVALAFVGGYVANELIHPDRVDLSSTEKAKADQVGDLQKLIIEQLQGRYYKKIDVDKLETASVTGMLKVLDDPWTVYMDPTETKKFEELTTGSYSGIGAGLEKKDGKLLVTEVFDGSPAKEAGIAAGDQIVSVDGVPTADKSVEANVANIKGPAGTDVILEIKKPGKGAEKLTLTRRTIKIPETETKMIEKDGKKIGYVRLNQYAEGVGDTIRKNVDELEAQGAQAIILDLRYNGGGLISEAVNVTSDFLKSGTIVSTEGLHSPKEVYKALGDPATSLPMVVLVNKWTASASEITTGALQDNDRATVIGTRTFGKGLVQTLVDLPNGATLKLTTAVYLTPDGHDINHKGITPDIKAVDDPKTKPDEALDRAVQYLATGQ
jgi:carboxyl-terminal processing protease